MLVLLPRGLRGRLKWWFQSNKGTYISKQMLPARLLVASKKICNSGPAAASITSSGFPATNRRTVKKMKPVKTPMPTHAIMIFGPSTDGLGISSILLLRSVLRNLGAAVFLALHVGHCIETCKTQTSLEQSKKPRNTIWPACFINEVAIDEVAGGIIWRGAGENGD